MAVMMRFQFLEDREQLGIILEFKTVRDKKISLQQAARVVLQQITQRQYAAQLQQLGIQHILKVGLAFRGKHVKVLSEENVIYETTDAG